MFSVVKLVFSDEIKEAVEALASEKRWKIIELLQESEGLAYTELLNCLGIQKGSLSHHLSKLMEAGIIDNYSQDDFRGPYFSYYKLSQFGKDVISGLLSSVEVPIITKITKSYVETDIATSYSLPGIRKFYEAGHNSVDNPKKLSTIAVQVFAHPRNKSKNRKSNEDSALLDFSSHNKTVSPQKEENI